MKKKIVLVFGVFDLFHRGHSAFLKQAQRHGNSLFVVIARDKSVLNLKGKKPDHSESQRARVIKSVRGVKKVFLGDMQQGRYSVIKKYKPDVICLGYDQNGLKKDLERRIKNGELLAAKLITLKPHKPHLYKTSIARKSLRKN